MDEKVKQAALTLALKFTEEASIPAEYKGNKKAKEKASSKLEDRFKATIEEWGQLIEVMLSKLEHKQAWRFIQLKPKASGKEKSVVECSDFLDFNDYFILRRDKEACEKAELGNMSLLFDAFQKVIERRMHDAQLVNLVNMKKPYLILGRLVDLESIWFISTIDRDVLKGNDRTTSYFYINSPDVKIYHTDVDALEKERDKLVMQFIPDEKGEEKKMPKML